MSSAASLRWDDLRFVLAAHRHGSLLGAAGALDTHASTVGRRLEALEASLGHALFDRTTTGLAPTALADELRPIAEAMEGRAAEVLRLVEQQETEPEGWVRLAAPPGIATYVVAPLLLKLAAIHPGIRVELVPAIDYADLTRREADLALRAVPPAAGTLVTRRLLEAEQSPHGSATLVAELGRVKRIEAVPWVSWTEAFAQLPSARWVDEHAPEAQVRMRCSSFEPQIEAARAGLGAVLVGSSFGSLAGLRPLSLAPVLRRKLGPFPTGAVHLVGHRALREVPRVAALWEFLIEECGRLG